MERREATILLRSHPIIAINFRRLALGIIITSIGTRSAFFSMQAAEVPKPYSKESMSSGTFEDISQSDRPRTRSVKTKNKRHRQR